MATFNLNSLLSNAMQKTQTAAQGANSAVQGAQPAQQNAVAMAQSAQPAAQQPASQYLTAADYAKFTPYKYRKFDQTDPINSPMATGYTYDGRQVIDGRVSNAPYDPNNREDAPGGWVGQGGKWVENTTPLTGVDARTYSALTNPYEADYNDIRAHPEYGSLRNKWYRSNLMMDFLNSDQYGGPTENFYKYFPREQTMMDALEKKYGMKDDASYMPLDYYMRDQYTKSPLSKSNPVVNPVERARLAGEAWAKQPSLAGKNINWLNEAPWSSDEKIAAAREYINEELREDKKREKSDGGIGKVVGALGLGLGFLGAPLAARAAMSGMSMLGKSGSGGGAYQLQGSTPTQIQATPKQKDLSGLFDLGKIQSYYNR